MDEQKIAEYKALVEQGNKARKDLEKLDAEVHAQKEVCKSLLKELGLSKLSEVDTVLQPKLEELEKEIVEMATEIKAYIKYANEMREQREQELL